ncbi:MAG TPA: hypothetical protein VFP35_02690 [Candidatus Saccharimonadales bacterium]|nr:hypothetical protein [Candidatus Saccharimonadales bacterium]
MDDSHPHVVQAHHHGLVAGTIIGSVAVTLFLAVAAVVARPNLLTHPLDLTSDISVKSSSNSNQALGSAASASQSQFTGGRGLAAGSAAQSAVVFSGR